MEADEVNMKIKMLWKSAGHERLGENGIFLSYS